MEIVVGFEPHRASSEYSISVTRCPAVSARSADRTWIGRVGERHCRGILYRRLNAQHDLQCADPSDGLVLGTCVPPDGIVARFGGEGLRSALLNFRAAT
jgi:hypothetical protein